MRKTVYQFILIVAIFLALQGCVSHPYLTAEQLKGPLVVVRSKNLAKNQAQACGQITHLQVSSPDYPKAAKEAGILADDLLSLRQTVMQLQLIITVRNANQSCEPYLKAGYPSKGHEVLTKTLNGKIIQICWSPVACTIAKSNILNQPSG